MVHINIVGLDDNCEWCGSLPMSNDCVHVGGSTGKVDIEHVRPIVEI